MVAGIIELRGPGTTRLRILTDEQGWSQVELATDDRTVALGADARRIVIDRLLSGVTDSLTGKTSGEIRGLTVRWIMSLAERHCSIYAADVGMDRHLFFQGSAGELLATLVLSKQQRRDWLHELQRVP